MASRLEELDWEELFSTKTETTTPDVESVPTFATGGVDAPLISVSDLSSVEEMTRSSQKQNLYELLSYMGESSTPELEIVAGRASGGVNVPKVGMAEPSDCAQREKFDRRLKRAICGPPDMDDKFISHFQLYHSELRRSGISSLPKDVGGCKISRDSNSTESGFGM